MVTSLFTVQIHERADMYTLYVYLSHFDGLKLVDNEQSLTTTFSKDSVPYTVDSIDWMQCLLSLVRRELSYEAAQHLAPGAIRPIGEGMQHVPIKPGEIVDGA